ncbi:MAG: 50S ribosomal protein L11 methyltransferase [Acidimicrobiales bacterium]
MPVAVIVVVDAEHAELVSIELFDLGATAIGEAARADGQIALTAGFASTDQAQSAVDRLGPRDATIDRDADADGWIETQRETFSPTDAGTWTVRAPWHAATGDPTRIDLVIDPGAAFGHGGHATTTLLLDMIPSAVEPGAHVLDVGTGTGVLAIAAATIGATVTAIEKDPVAVEIARGNVSRNGMDDRVRTELIDAGSTARDADIAFVNVTIDVHRLVAHSLNSVPLVLISGILDEQLDEAVALYGRPVLELQRSRPWVAARLGSEPVLAR